MPVRFPVRMLSRTSVPLIAWPWIEMPAVFNPALFQSVVLFPARVMVNPAMVTLLAATCIVVPGPPIGPLTMVVPAPAPSTATPFLLMTTSSL